MSDNIQLQIANFLSENEAELAVLKTQNPQLYDRVNDVIDYINAKYVKKEELAPPPTPPAAPVSRDKVKLGDIIKIKSKPNVSYTLESLEPDGTVNLSYINVKGKPDSINLELTLEDIQRKVDKGDFIHIMFIPLNKIINI